MPDPKPPQDDASRRTPLELTKPPREWRSQRPQEPVAGGTPTGAVVHSQTVVPVPAGLPRSPERPEASLAVPRLPMPPPREQPGAIDTGPALPGRYGVDRLVLLVRDPHWTYAWWELTEVRLMTARGELAEPGQLMLRFYDVSLIEWDGSNHHHSFDIEVHDPAGNWYVELGRPGASFVAEIGLRATDGRFLPLVRSNVVSLPRDSMSPVADESWMILEDQYRRMFELSGGDAIGLGSGEILRALEERLRRELVAGGVSSFGISSLASRRES